MDKTYTEGDVTIPEELKVKALADPAFVTATKNKKKYVPTIEKLKNSNFCIFQSGRH